MLAKAHATHRALLISSFISCSVSSLYCEQCDQEYVIIIIFIIMLHKKMTNIIVANRQNIAKCLCDSIIPDYVEYSSSSETMNGVIWSKTQKTFVPISSVPVFAMMQQERLKQSRALETHNFQLQNLTLTSFQVCFHEAQMAEFLDILHIFRFLSLKLISENDNFTIWRSSLSRKMYISEAIH